MKNTSKKKTLGFTLVELLAVVSIVAILSIIAIPIIRGVKTNAVKKEGATNVMNIAATLDKFYADGNFTYTNGTAGACNTTDAEFCQAGCKNCTNLNTIYSGTNMAMVIQGEYYYYTVEAGDLATNYDGDDPNPPDTDTLCGAYRITATGCAGKISNGQSLVFTSTGAKTGDWN